MSPWAVAAWGAAFGAGLFLWTFIEYLVHGILSHRFRTFVSPLHGSHHKEPRGVFTSILAWGPIAIAIFAAAIAGLGTDLGLALGSGILAGFVHYEWFHWRIHFRQARTPRQRLLRNHHLAHHFRDGRNYHGVTTRFWDHVFGTIAPGEAEDYAQVANHPALPGASNFWMAWNPIATLRLLRSGETTPRR